MEKNNWFWLIVALIFGCTFWVTVGAVKKAYVYYSLDKKSELSAVKWTIHPVNDERYLLQAEYSFPAKERTYFGKSLLSSLYRNPWSAEKGLEEIRKERWSTWYSSRNPEINALEKSFPMKETIYTLIMWVLMAYFIGLMIYSLKRPTLQR